MMKKHVLFFVAALTAISMSVQGCGSKESAAEPTTTAAAEVEETTEEAAEEETTEEAAEAEAADEAVGETGIPAEYEKYLDWTGAEWEAASEDEKKEALIAYVLYDGIVYQGITDLTADMVKDEPEIDQLMPIIETGLLGSGNSSLKEICDLGHSAVMGVADLDLDEDVIEKLQCTAADWAAADDATKKEVVSAMLLAVGQMTGQDITMEMIETLPESDMQAQVDNVGAMFESGLYGDDITLYEMLTQ